MTYKFLDIKEKYYLSNSVWMDNPWVKYISPFKELYDRDTSLNKETSSKEMTSIWLYADPSYQNKIGKLEEVSKKSAILAYNSKFNFEDELIQQCIIAYPECCTTPAARMFMASQEELAKRLEFMKNTPYLRSEAVKDKNGAVIFVAGKPLMTDNTVTLLEAMHKNTIGINKQYETVKKMYEEEMTAEGRLHGGGQRTLMDEGGMMLLDDED